MKSPTFDRDGYPTDETLDALRAWGDADANAALDFIARARDAGQKIADKDDRDYFFSDLAKEPWNDCYR